jgi:hypothetical protein
MKITFTEWERYLLNKHRLAERTNSAGVAMVFLPLLGLGCAGGLIAGWCGAELPDLAWDLLWIGAISFFAGTASVWREWRLLSLVKKLRDRVLELEDQQSGAVPHEQESISSDTPE